MEELDRRYDSFALRKKIGKSNSDLILDTADKLKRRHNKRTSNYKSEVGYAIRCTKDRKTAGPDGIPVELLKLINEKRIQILVDLFNTVFNTGIIPTEW
ncbi:hypothetical protein ILUMI_11844 [Ignelater luminosus]|uniref:Uncharacterized protein n=1 Tax=Ignelater luminosus TaxID=2038154 RepID=A0A8K0GCC7_IGNLU|nr:hypothetical protein ILUMI_11844 [Ignelater luminosus]